MGDGLAFQMKNRLPADAEVRKEHIYIPSDQRPKGRLNTDCAHWPLPDWPNKEDLV